jgi:hypothetical protein
MTKIKYRCTCCKKEFRTLKQGFKHFDEVKHEWGGLEHIDKNDKQIYI